MSSIQIIFDGMTSDIADPIDISIPLKFNGEQPNAFGVDAAAAKACEYGDLVGDTRRGGSCNFEQVVLIPHCNGTHTECVGHITKQRISVRECLTDVFITSQLITLEPVDAENCGESYHIPFENGDRVITRNLLESPLSFSEGTGLVIRTLPNDDRKLHRMYGEPMPPYFTAEAMKFIVSKGISHLLVDLPSIDRMNDGGTLSNHRAFWNVELGSFDIGPHTRRNSTVTELIYVPNEISDGEYLLNLQIAPFESDASPSRPVLFKIKG
jgi:kynurenine formamidase